MRWRLALYVFLAAEAIVALGLDVASLAHVTLFSRHVDDLLFTQALAVCMVAIIVIYFRGMASTALVSAEQEWAGDGVRVTLRRDGSVTVRVGESVHELEPVDS